MWFESVGEAQSAVTDLRALGGAALRLLRECVQEQGVTRSKASAAAIALEDAGFVFIRDLCVFDDSVRITPSLWGEEALELLDEEAGVVS